MMYLKLLFIKTLIPFYTHTYVSTTNATEYKCICNMFFCFRNSKIADQAQLLKLLWELWPLLPTYGRKAAQFVDLLGYFSLRFSETSESSQQVNTNDD